MHLIQYHSIAGPAGTFNWPEFTLAAAQGTANLHGGSIMMPESQYNESPHLSLILSSPT